MQRALAGVTREILPQKHDRNIELILKKLSSDLHMCVKAQEHTHSRNKSKNRYKTFADYYVSVSHIDTCIFNFLVSN